MTSPHTGQPAEMLIYYLKNKSILEGYYNTYMTASEFEKHHTHTHTRAHTRGHGKPGYQEEWPQGRLSHQLYNCFP